MKQSENGKVLTNEHKMRKIKRNREMWKVSLFSALFLRTKYFIKCLNKNNNKIEAKEKLWEMKRNLQHNK